MLASPHEDSRIPTGSILPIDLLLDNMPVTEYFKVKNLGGELVPSHGGEGTDLEELKGYYDFFKIGNIDNSAQSLIDKKLIEPAKKNLDSLVHDFKEKLYDSDFLDGIYYSDQLKEKFVGVLESIYSDHLTLLNIKKITDSNRKLLEQSLDICSLATLLALRSNVLPEQVDTICKGSLLINIGKTQMLSHTDEINSDHGHNYLKILGYDEAIVNIVRYKFSFELNTPEPRLVIGIVKASYLYHLSLQKYRPSSVATGVDDHSVIMRKLKGYVGLGYLNPKIYFLISRVFNESKRVKEIR